jgi:protein phosphatase
MSTSEIAETTQVRQTYTIGSRTDKGMQRSGNEDSVLVLNLPGVDACFVLADGMGGLRAGEVASGEVIRVIGASFTERLTPTSDADRMGVLDEAIHRANDAVNALARPEMPKHAAGDEPTLRDPASVTAAANALMGSTVVAGFVRDETLYLGHVGDSRAYLFRDGVLSRLTDDHSFVADRVRAGDMTEAEARVSRFRNMITRAVGIEPTILPDLREVPLTPGDVVLICSDGLTTMLEDEQISEILESRQTQRLSPERAASTLVDAANRAGGHDNVTVVLLRVHQPGQENAIAAPTASAEHAHSGRQTARAAATTAVIDMDGAKVRHSSGESRLDGIGLPPAWPLIVVFALLGMLSVVAAGALVAMPDLRNRMALAFSSGAPATTAIPVPSAANVDYAHLTYGPPEDFGSYAARGDILSYSPGAGLYFVGQGSGKLVCLSRTGVPVANVANFPPAPPAPNPAPDTHVFVTSDLQGNVYISYTRERQIVKKGRDGAILQRLTGFTEPEAIAVDETGNLYVVDLNLLKILRAHTQGSSAAATAAPSAASTAVTPVSLVGTQESSATHRAKSAGTSSGAKHRKS